MVLGSENFAIAFGLKFQARYRSQCTQKIFSEPIFAFYVFSMFFLGFSARQPDGRKGGRTDRRTVGWTDGRTDGRADGQTDGRMDGRSDGWSDGRSDGRTVGRTVGRKSQSVA